MRPNFLMFITVMISIKILCVEAAYDTNWLLFDAFDTETTCMVSILIHLY